MLLILSKVPEEMRLTVARNIEKNEWNIGKVLCTFKLELEARKRDVTHSRNLVLPGHLKIKCTVRENCPIRHQHCFLEKLVHLYHTLVTVRSSLDQRPAPCSSPYSDSKEKGEMFLMPEIRSYYKIV